MANLILKVETSETVANIKIENTTEPEVIIKIKSEETNEEEEEGDSDSETEAFDYYPKCQICNLEFGDEGALVVHNFNNHWCDKEREKYTAKFRIKVILLAMFYDSMVIIHDIRSNFPHT